MQKQIVIIDDEFFFRQALMKYISNFAEEFVVVGDASNGEQGISLIEKFRPEIILIDISMPQMTGFDVIHYITEKKITARFIVISGYDKFEYAQQAIKLGVQDFLLKPVTVEGLYKSLKKVSDSIDLELKKEDNLKRLEQENYGYQTYMKHFAASQFVRQDISNEQLEKLAGEAGYNLTHPGHVAILYHVNHLPKTWKQSEYELYYFMVENVCCELLGDGVSSISFINFQGSLCMILGLQEMQLQEFRYWISGVMERVISVCDEKKMLQTTVTVGRCVEQAKQIYDSYIEAFSLEKKTLFYEKAGVHFSDEAVWKESDSRVVQQDGEVIQKLLQAMRQNHKMLAREIINTFIDSMMVIQLSMEQFLLQINKILSAIVTFAEEYGVSETISRNNKLFSVDYINTSSISEIHIELIQYMEYILTQVHASKTSNTSVIVRKIKEYIQANYMVSGLCLEQIADALDVNLQYMCFLFKKKTDMTIGNYILQTRMDMASRLFKRTGYNVSEVAEKVGFEDMGYFSKCFKKYFGVSPKQYQNICQTEKNSDRT